MLVFDEVYWVKGVGGQCVKVVLSLSQILYYCYVLMGILILNGFRDIYNFLYLMYFDEYLFFFVWDLIILNNIDLEDVNKKLLLFFWWINKKDLYVFKLDLDIIKEVELLKNQQMLLQVIYEIENGILVIFIRLL